MEAAKSTSLKLHEVWKNANLLVKAEHVIRRNIRNLHNECVSLKKDAKRKTPSAVRKRDVWKASYRMSSILQAVRLRRPTSQKKIWPFWNCRGWTYSPVQWRVGL